MKSNASILLLAIALLVIGFLVDFLWSGRLPWVLRRFLPPVLYGTGFGALIAVAIHVIGALSK